jgi:hypothetical protein
MDTRTEQASNRSNDFDPAASGQHSVDGALRSIITAQMQLYLTSILAWCKTWWSPPVYLNESRFRDVERWALDFMPEQDEKDLYAPILIFSERYYERALKSTENLDKKADDLIRVASAIGAALAATAKIAGASKAVVMLPAIGLLILTIIIATRARLPAFQATPIDIRTLIEIAKHESSHKVLGILGELNRVSIQSKGQVEQIIAATIQCAVVGVQLLNDWKAKQIERASTLFCLAMTSLFVIMISS